MNLDRNLPDVDSDCDRGPIRDHDRDHDNNSVCDRVREYDRIQERERDQERTSTLYLRLKIIIFILHCS